jgi:hypothetical protein
MSSGGRFTRPSDTAGPAPHAAKVTSVEQHKPWYDGGGHTQMWRLLERQKSQQKNPGIAGELQCQT